MADQQQKQPLVRPTLVDRVVHYINPTRGLERMQARARYSMLEGSGYIGSSRLRNAMRGWGVSGRSQDVHAVEEGETLRARAADLYRNAPLATSAIRTQRTNVVGTGLRLQVRPDRDYLGLSDAEADNWEREVERLWRAWAETTECDAARTQNFYGIQALQFTTALLAGDAFAVMPRKERAGSPFALRVLPIEPERVSQPQHRMNSDRIAGGIEIDALGAPVAYYISRNNPGGYDLANRWDRVPAFGRRSGRRNVLHLYYQEYPGQRRGVSDLAPVIEPLKQLSRYTEAEITAAVVSGMFSVFITSEGGELPNSPYAEDEQVDADDPSSLEIGNGSVIGLEPGEKPETASPGRPNDNFDPFFTAIVRQIGSALEIPYEVLIKHFTSS
ncbi:MAG: phage portal protein, partial [Thiohalorhabdus sp.]